MRMLEDQEMIPTLEAAERLGIDVLDVYRMIDEGRLTAAWDGHRLVVPVAQIEALTGSTR
jgi:excisionase family DNA binding protein